MNRGKPSTEARATYEAKEGARGGSAVRKANCHDVAVGGGEMSGADETFRSGG